MPLVRVEVKNEYKLGMPDLYKEVNRDDPKAVLDGVAVAGLVGILRQLGDLAEFAAEVFHDLQEQVLDTSCRSQKLIVRLHNVEAALPPLEKAILAQKSHLHFAYAAGSHWHARLRIEQNHFIYSDLPQCIMDSYEESRDPPRLHLLDKFDLGGPGSCLKRYSDPTFFKKAKASSAASHISNVQRDKRTRQSKKRSWRRNKQEIYDAPISTDSGRMQSVSPDAHGQSFSSQEVSVFECAIRSDRGNNSNSFDLRTGSNYIDCVFGPSYSTHSDENEPKEVVSASFDKQSGMIHARIANSPPEEQTCPQESCVTWDEKTEILETVQSTDCQINFDYNEEHMPASVSGGGQLEDIESETDYYVDALNTIESESETDLDCQTKRELKKYSCVDKAKDEKQMASLSNAYSVNTKSHAPTSALGPSQNSFFLETRVEDHCFLNDEASEKITNIVPLESNAYIQNPQITGTSLIPHLAPKVLMSENGNIVDSNVGPSIESPSSRESISQAPMSDKIVITCESPMPSSASSGVPPVMFWTNGDMLGLEPSKPQDFSLPMDSRQQSLSKSKYDFEQPSGGSHIPGNKLDQSGDSNHSSNNNDDHIHDSCSSTTLKPEIMEIVNQDGLKSSKAGGNSGPQIFEFSNRLLENGLRRQVSLVGDKRLASSLRSDISEQASRAEANQISKGKSFRESFGNGSTIMSSCSSPPLEHMKISFQPIDGFETSKLKLKLKLPDGSSCQESSGDMFHSFQLVPEPALSLHDSGSDSDDDIFCRSSSSISDDCHSHNSQSNSELWENDESPGSKDHEANDGSNISPKQLVLGKPHGDLLEPSLSAGSGRLQDLPNFDSLSASLNREIINSNRSYVLDSHFLKEPTPPPLPPMQWRGIKSHPDEMDKSENTLSDALNSTLDLKFPISTISQQPKPAPVNQDNDVETIEKTPKSKPDSEKLNGQKNAGWFSNGKVSDEKDDFLQQIRAKSFNLRRTVSAQPTFTPRPPTNFKVTAILEKANAIRQAVGSDDGTDDDNWSDT